MDDNTSTTTTEPLDVRPAPLWVFSDKDKKILRRRARHNAKGHRYWRYRPEVPQW